MIWVDTLRDRGWRLGPSAHLMASTLDELHAAAAEIGLKRQWFQDHSIPHYDLTAGRRAAAVDIGAREVTDRQAIVMARGVQAGQEFDATFARVKAVIES